jgi:hypothetical protein
MAQDGRSQSSSSTFPPSDSRFPLSYRGYILRPVDTHAAPIIPPAAIRDATTTMRFWNQSNPDAQKAQ